MVSCVLAELFNGFPGSRSLERLALVIDPGAGSDPHIPLLRMTCLSCQACSGFRA